MPLGELAGLVNARISSGSADGVSIHGISLASSRVQPGDLFAALPGVHTHGLRFVDDAIAHGAVAICTDPEGARACAGVKVPIMEVADPRSVLGELAAALYQHPARNLRMLGVTGTQGKTTTSRLLEGALTAAGLSAAVIGTIGTRINGQVVDSALTTPEAPDLQGLLARMVEQGVETCVMELSSHALVLGRVEAITFDAAAFLNLGRDHLDFHHDLDNYFMAKSMLFTEARARRGLTNIDDPHGRRLLEVSSIPMQTMSTRGRDADWQAVDLEPDSSGTSFRVLGPHGEDLRTRVGLVGEFNVENALCAIALGACSGLDAQSISTGLSTAPVVPGRLEVVTVGQPFLAIVDYAHKPDAVAAALKAVRQMTSGRVILVLGAGGDRDQGKRSMMGEVAARLADHFIITDDNPRTEDPAMIRNQLQAGAEQVDRSDRAVITEVADRGEAIRAAVAMAQPGDGVIIAGKGHETGQEINGTVHPFDDREQLRIALEAVH
jgi:UDP-N-acetylmuramoyl-L-alanyl-D-glutamate--2,6-diaminopimelate ligase